MKRAGIAAVIVLLGLGTGGALAQVPPADAIPNWSVPATWSPSVDAGGIQVMTDVTAPRLFVGISPCRIADTRTGQGFSGQAGPPILPANTTRNFQISGTPATLPAPPNGCPANAIPPTAQAVSVQFTIVSPSDAGNLLAWPAGGTQPQVSVLNWPAGMVALGSGTIVSLSGTGALSVRLNMGVGQVSHLVIDVNGYFASSPQTQSSYLQLTNSSNGYTAYFSNDSVTCGGICGLFMGVAEGTAIQGETTGDDTGIFGVEGRVVNFTTNSAGVSGIIGNPFGTGGCCGPAGVRGQSPHAGVIGLGVQLGVAGRNFDPSGNVLSGGDLGVQVSVSPTFSYGVQGISLTTATGSAGVKGQDYSGEPAPPGFTCCGVAGVRGSSVLNIGVDGVTRDGIAVSGMNKDGNGINLAQGILGFNDATGIYFVNNLAGTGTKSFVEPHPTDPTKAIRYVSLEGNEAGTYFRGRGKFERGLARIEIPEDFRLVTDPEGLTVQITPIGEMATYAVVRIGLDGIVVKSSRNVEFFYTVNGVRNAYREWQPIMTSQDFFMPASADEKIMGGYNPEERRRLIANGTYNADGSVNLETAERVGWTKIWKERKEKQEAALAQTRAKFEAEEAARVGP